MNLAVLISGGGRTLLNLQQRIEAGALPARIATVISSRGDVAGVRRARDAGLAVHVLERREMSRDEFQAGITRLLAGADLVCMAGFLSLWRIPEEFVGRVINIHPALLPDFGGPGMYGARVHTAVLAILALITLVAKSIVEWKTKKERESLEDAKGILEHA